MNKHRGGDGYIIGPEDNRYYNSANRFSRAGGDDPNYPFRGENHHGVRGGAVSSTYHGGSFSNRGSDGREDRRPFRGPPRYPVMYGGGDVAAGEVRPIGEGVDDFRPVVDGCGGRGGFQPMGGNGIGFKPMGVVGAHFGSVGRGRGNGERFPPMGGGGIRGDGERFPSIGGGGDRGDSERFRPGSDEERVSLRSGGGRDGERFQPMGGGDRFPPMDGSERFQPMEGGGANGGVFQPRRGRSAENGGGMFGPAGGGDGGKGNGERFKPTGGEGDRERSLSIGSGERFRAMGRGDTEKFRPMDSGDVEQFRPMDSGGNSGDGERFQLVGRNDDGGLNLDDNCLTPFLTGQKRGYPFYGRERSPGRSDGASFVKLFVGSLPRSAAEFDIRPLFDKHGHVMEVALIRDKRTGQPQGCCFIKYASSEEADRAIKALHNQYTLPEGIGPIQVRYADGERERLGATEHKLFVGSLNKQASEKEVEEIFLPYGRVEDVYLMRDEMKQSRGCGFVKYSQREMAEAAINALNGTYIMRGCDQPLNVRFADPKRPRPGEPRGGPPGMGFGPRFSAPGIRPAPDYGDSLRVRIPSISWPQEKVGPPATVSHGFDLQLPARSGDLGTSTPGSIGGHARNNDGSVPGHTSSSAPTSQFQPPNIASSTNVHSAQGSSTQLGPKQKPYSAGQTPRSQAPSTRLLPGFNGQFPYTQPQVSHKESLTTGKAPGSANQLPAQHHQPHSQSPSQLARMLSQQKQTLQATFQSSQQAFNQLQQQVQQLQPSTHNVTAHQGSQAIKQQPPWNGMISQPVTSNSNVHPPGDVTPSPSVSFFVPSVAPAVSVSCNWTELTSPDGYNYYYNCSTGESKWDKPEELIQYEQLQKHQKRYSQYSQVHRHPHVSSTQQSLEMQVQSQGQRPAQHQNQIQQMHNSIQTSLYEGPGLPAKLNSKELNYAQIPGGADVVNDATRYQQIMASQEWIRKNKPSGT